MLQICAVLGAAACGTEVPADFESFGSEGGTPPDTTSGASSTTLAADTGESTGSSDAASSSSTGQAVPDVAGPDMGVALDGCRGVDVLFAIEDGPDDLDESRLVLAVAEFMLALDGAIPAGEHRVMVVDSAGYAEGACWRRRGVGGRGSSQGACIPEDEPNYLAGTEDIETLFPCLAHVGNNRAKMDSLSGAMLTALSPEFTGEDGCNEGFVRDDAVLLIVMMARNEGAGPVGATWAEILSRYKDPVATVALALLGDHPADDDPASLEVTPWGTAPVCPLWTNYQTPNEARPNPGLVEFANALGDRGFLGSICAEDYTPAFNQTLDAVTTACELL